MKQYEIQIPLFSFFNIVDGFVFISNPGLSLLLCLCSNRRHRLLSRTFMRLMINQNVIMNDWVFACEDEIDRLCNELMEEDIQLTQSTMNLLFRNWPSWFLLPEFVNYNCL